MIQVDKIRPKPIFPEIMYERKIDGVELETYVRILRSREYYTLLFKETIQFPLGEIVDPSYVARGYQRLIEAVYNAIHFREFADWQLPDTDQTPEEERLKKIYPFFSIKTNVK